MWRLSSLNRCGKQDGVTEKTNAKMVMNTMDKKEIQAALMQLICTMLKGEGHGTSAGEIPDSESIAEIYLLAKKHSLGHLVSRFVFINKIDVEEELLAKLRMEELMSVYKHERMKYAFHEICEILENAKVDYLPLKGSAIRSYYPDESMRTSCDIDILIHESDLNRAVLALKNKGYQGGERHYHDVSLYSPNKIHLELHFSIQENIEALDAVLKDAWEYAVQVDGCCYDFRKEFFVFQMYAHMAYHFLSGGCGIRSLMDIWIMEHNMQVSYSVAEKLLKKAGIYKFASQMSEIVNKCFDEREVSDPVMEYIWRGGTYGSVQNNTTIQTIQLGGMTSYVWRRIFPPYKSMVVSYPVLCKIPLLLPACWILRWIKAISSGKTQQLSSEITWANNVSEDEIAEIKKILMRLGL